MEQLHERGEKVIQNIRVRAKKQRADIEAEAAPPPTKNGVSRTTVVIVAVTRLHVSCISEGAAQMRGFDGMWS